MARKVTWERRSCSRPTRDSAYPVILRSGSSMAQDTSAAGPVCADKRREFGRAVLLKVPVKQHKDPALIRVWVCCMLLLAEDKNASESVDCRAAAENDAADIQGKGNGDHHSPRQAQGRGGCHRGRGSAEWAAAARSLPTVCAAVAAPLPAAPAAPAAGTTPAKFDRFCLRSCFRSVSCD